MSMNPPCRYLIDPHIKVKMDLGEKATEILDDLKQIEHKPQTKKDSKIVDVEVIDDSEITIPKVEIESEEKIESEEVN